MAKYVINKDYDSDALTIEADGFVSEGPFTDFFKRDVDGNGPVYRIKSDLVFTIERVQD